MTIKKAGNINACVLASLFNGEIYVGRCYSTTNAIAYGMHHTGATKAISYYPGWPDEVKTREDIGLDRIKAAGWFKSDAEAGLLSLKKAY